jgi:hypothetical protein
MNRGTSLTSEEPRARTPSRGEVQHSSLDPSDAETRSPSMNPCRTAAHECAARSWWVFPLHSIRADGVCTCNDPRCDSAGKHPLTPHGLGDATADLTVIDRWFDRWAFANLAIATGPESGIVALDEDPRHGGDVTLASLVREHGELQPTPVNLTGSGGRHFVFQHPGFYVKSRSNALGPGLDVKGDGGYIVGPPSRHVSGRTYAWDVRRHPDDIPLAPLPEWVTKMLGGGDGTGRTREATPPSEWRDIVLNGVTSGARNTTAARLAGHLLRRRVDAFVTLELVRCWNAARCQPALADDELVRTVDSIARAELRRRGGAT